MKKVFKLVKFPSPYGVLFILMYRLMKDYTLKECLESFRLLTEYYSFLLKENVKLIIFS